VNSPIAASCSETVIWNQCGMLAGSGCFPFKLLSARV
jgi:hypothetical protein